MMNPEFLTARPPNLILTSLPGDEYQKLVPHLRQEVFRVGDVIYSDSSAEYLHFLNWGVAAMCLSNDDGDNLELCLIGNEGVIGARSVCLHNQFNLRCEMLSKGSGFKLPVKIFLQLFRQCPQLARLALLQFETRTLETASTALCNQSHPVEKRFIRWLLTFADRFGSDRLAATHEMIAAALGVQRSSISIASKNLQNAGLISSYRGHIHIVEREQLEKRVCGCYFSTREMINNYRRQTRADSKSERSYFNRTHS